MMVGISTLCHLELAEQHGARLTQATDDGRVFGWLEVLVDAHARRSLYALGPEQVLHRKWNAMKRSTVAAGDHLCLGRVCLCHRALGSDNGVAGEPAIQRSDPVELSAGRLDGRY